jgi:hypothetical protein
LLRQLSGDPQASIHKACGERSQSKAAYAFIGNEKVKEETIIRTHNEVTCEIIRETGEEVILVAQDTTSFNYSGLVNTTGLGVIGHKDNQRGIFMHSALAITTQGRALGLLSQTFWVRQPKDPGRPDVHKERPITEKESNRWLETMRQAERGDHGKAKLVHLCDREGDMYELFQEANQAGNLFLVRRVQDRRIGKEETISTFLGNQPVAGTYEVEVPRDSKTSRKARIATLEVVYGRVKIRRPNLKGVRMGQSEAFVEASLISAHEINAPEGVEPLDWQLITNMEAPNFDTVRRYIGWYTRRWMIETFHYTLKSGCMIERLQAETVESLRKIIEIYSIIAINIMNITYFARIEPEASCESVVTPIEWQMLYRIAKRTRTLPLKPPTVREAYLMIAKLGGYTPTKSGGPPGVKVMWWGMTKLMTICDAAPFVG